MNIVTLSSQPALSELPQSFAINLSDFSAISLIGVEQTKYLQGQVTCDVNALTDHNLMNGAHCDAKGKVFSVFRLINRLAAHLLIQNKATIDPSLKELKKFGVFSKVTIEACNELGFLALVGETAQDFIKTTFGQLPDNLSPVLQSDSCTIVYISGQQARYLLIDEQDKIAEYLNKIASTNLPIFPHPVWELLEIVEGFPSLTAPVISEYAPQMLNVQAINGISFTKGCYLGQETVARMQYLGKNKRALFSLFANEKLDITADSVVENQLGENWRRAGNLITHYQADNGETYLQAVLSSDLTKIDKLRLKGNDKVTLAITPLPYSIINE